MQEAYEITMANAKKKKKCAERSKRYYDSKVRSSVSHKGDQVLIRNMIDVYTSATVRIFRMHHLQ